MNTASSIMTYAFYVPSFLVALLGLLLALVHMRDYRMPAVLTLIGCSILIVMSVVDPVVRDYLLRRAISSSASMSSQTYSTLMTVEAAISTILRTLASAMILLAVFAGRQRSMPASGFPVVQPLPRDQNSF